MKKIMSSLITLVFIIGLFVGCGAENAVAQSVPTEKADETIAVVSETGNDLLLEESTTEPVTENTTSNMTIEYPIESDVTLTLFDQFNSMQASDMCSGFEDAWFWETVQQNTGISLEFIITSPDQYSTQFNLVIASGDYYDLMGGFAQYYTNAKDAAVEEGIILNIADFADYCPDYMAVLQENGGKYLKDAETDSGIIPVFYTIDDTKQGVDSGLYVRQDWLNDLNMDVPVTIDQFTDVLRAFKTELSVEQPLFVGQSMSPAYMSCFDIGGLYDSRGGVPMMQIDGTVYMQCLTDGFRDVLTTMNSWYNEGLISNSFSSQDDNTMPTSQVLSEALLTGKTGMVSGTTNTVTDLEEAGRENDPDWEFTPMANPVKEEGQTLHIGVAPLANVDTNGYAVSGTCQHPEEAAMLCNYFYTEEGCLLRSFGQEGVTYEFDENGVPYFTEFFYANENYQRGQIMSEYFLASNVGLIYENRFISTKHERTQEFMDIWSSNYDCAYVLSSYYTMTVEENDIYSSLLGDLSTALQENALKFITGERPLEEIEEFQNEMISMGAEDVISVVQAAYDRYLAR